MCNGAPGWVKDQALAELAPLYPEIEAEKRAATGRQLSFQGEELSGAIKPVAYLWTRTVPCPNPTLDPHAVPLIRSTHVVRTDTKRISVRAVPDTQRLESSTSSWSLTAPRLTRRAEGGRALRRARSAVLRSRRSTSN